MSTSPDAAGSRSGAGTAGLALDLLRRAGRTLAVAESLTGGLLAARLVSVPGASSVLRGAVVAYATDLKATLLDVDPDLLAGRGPVDPEVAAQMAAGVRRRLAADVGVATTGVAGPDPQDGRRPGTVYVAVDLGDEVERVRFLELDGDREQVRSASVEAALTLLVEALGVGAGPR